MLTALVMALSLSGQAAAPAMPVIAGATASPDCGGIREVIAGGAGVPMQCVTAPLEQIGAMARGYATEAARHGWVQTGANNNVMWMQKPEEGGTCERLTIIGFWDSARYPEPRAGLPGYIGTIIQSGRPCETPTPVPTPQ